MASLPYMQLYVADYLADTQHLTGAQHGAYLLLMMNYWTRGKALVDSDERLCVVARTELAEWKEKIRPALEEFFAISEGLWMHGRIERDLEAVRTKCERASNAGKISAQRKSNERSTNVEVLLNRNSTIKKRREEKREEESKETFPPVVPTLSDHANVATTKVMCEAPLAGLPVRMAVELVARHEISCGLEPLVVADTMLDAWRDFKANGSKLQYAWGAEKFFGEGNWKDKTAWPWKEGKAPPPPNIRRHDPLEEIRRQNGGVQ